MNTVFTKAYTSPAFDRREILRYAGVRGDGDEFDALISECIDEVEDKLSYRVCFTEIKVRECDGIIDLGFYKTDSETVKKHLEGCDTAVLFGATAGIEIDRLIHKYGALSPAKALIFQSIGAERIEALCDAFCNDVAKEYGVETARRFSPGYGDFPLEAQKEIFSTLDCAKRIGLTLNNSMLMSPTKSVTAIIGIKRRKI